MTIVVYKKDKRKVPYLVHETNEYTVVLGLEDYPEIEQDSHTNIDEVRFLERGTIEYSRAFEFIQKI